MLIPPEIIFTPVIKCSNKTKPKILAKNIRANKNSVYINTRIRAVISGDSNAIRKPKIPFYQTICRLKSL